MCLYDQPNGDQGSGREPLDQGRLSARCIAIVLAFAFVMTLVVIALNTPVPK